MLEMVNYASISKRRASLSTDFGESFARRRFGDEWFDSLPEYSRGPRKGKKKGSIIWEKCEKGGWVRGRGYMGESEGHVEFRGIVSIKINSAWDESGETIKTWERG